MDLINKTIKKIQHTTNYGSSINKLDIASCYHEIYVLTYAVVVWKEEEESPFI